MENTIIHIQWEGPFTLQEAYEKLNNSKVDYGVYQIYGRHPVYGNDALLYIGKACERKRTFAVRFKEHEKHWLGEDSQAECATFYVGRLCGEKTPSDDEWRRLIDLAERLLIYTHWPGGNSSGLNQINDQEFYNVHILNWGSRRDLLPEVSGYRWTNKFNVEMKAFGSD